MALIISGIIIAIIMYSISKLSQLKEREKLKKTYNCRLRFPLNPAGHY
jgi:hypothetical protein